MTKMRLRLRIERNALPPTQALWPVKDSKSTIAQLLQHVNDIFPLEAETWGLEDYSVSVGGYDCLHYHELAAVCKDEDEVIIKPLQFVDVRSRALLGRNQISEDGRHLVDGIPFGRPCIKAPLQPVIRIPPRKRQRLLEEGPDEQAEEAAVPLMLMANEGELGDADADEEDEEDEDFEVESSEVASSSEVSSSEDESDESSSSESESDSSSAPSSSSEADESSDAESANSWSGIPATPQRKAALDLPNGTATSQAHDSPTGSKRKRQSNDHAISPDEGHQAKVAKQDNAAPREGNSETKSRNIRRREANKLKHLKSTQVLPPDATLETMREWQHGSGSVEVEMEYGDQPEADAPSEEQVAQPSSLKEPEVAPKVTGAMEEADPNVANGDADALTQSSKRQRKRERKKTARAQKGVESEQQTQPKQSEQQEQQRQQLLSAIASGGIDVTKKASTKKQPHAIPANEEDDEVDGPPQEISSKRQAQATVSVVQAVADDETEQQPVISQDAPMIPASVARRSKLDLASSKRLLFGSLGVRVPKTQEERDRLQEKLAQRPKRSAVHLETNAAPEVGASHTNTPVAEGQQSTETEEDLEAWRDKIELTAVECCEEGVTLSTPPFPFYQRWDPQQRRKKTAKRINGKYMDGGGKKRKRGQQSTEYIESYDRYNTDGNGDALEYDDPVDEDDKYWEDGALLDGEEDDDAPEDDGFPPLPEDLQALRVLKVEDAHQEDYIAYTELACEESTGWQPKMVTRTAKILDTPNSNGQCILQLSGRDVKPRVFDADGNRVYSKFEMPDDESEGEDETIDESKREMTWSELGEVRLVLRPTSPV